MLNLDENFKRLMYNQVWNLNINPGCKPRGCIIGKLIENKQSCLDSWSLVRDVMPISEVSR